MKTKLNYSIGVDTGTVTVMPISLVDEYTDAITLKEVEEKENGYFISLPIGKYSVEISMKDTWNGDVSKKGLLSVEMNEGGKEGEGLVYIGDPCYAISDDSWNVFTDKFFFGKEVDERFFYIDSMGGDGLYETTIVITTM